MGRRLDPVPGGEAAPPVCGLDPRTKLVCRFRPDGTLLHVNEAYARCLGLSRDELVGRPLFSVLPDSERGRLHAHLASLVGDPRVATRSHQTMLANGNTGWQVWVDQPILSDNDQVIEFQSVGHTADPAARDIENPLLAAALNEAQFLTVCDRVDALFWLRDCKENCVIWASSAYERIWGRRLEDLYTDPFDWVLACVPADRARVAAALAGDPISFHEIYRIQTADGTERWIEDRSFPIFNEAGEVCKVAGVADDITHRRRAEHRLEQEERLLRTTLDSLPTCIAAVAQGGHIAMVNAAWSKFIEEHSLNATDWAVGASYLHAFAAVFGPPAEFQTIFEKSLSEVLLGKRNRYACEFAAQRAGENRWYEISISACDTDGERLAVVAHKDVTDKALSAEKIRRQEAEVTHIGRVAMLAEISAGFAHELNQPLAAILNYCEGCLARLKRTDFKDEEVVQSLTRARDLAMHAAELVRRLRQVMKKSPPHHSSVSIHAIVNEVVEMLRYELESQGIVLVLDLDDSVPLLLADQVRLQQVLLNLVLNSMAAVSGAALGRRKITIATRKDGKTIQVSVKDTGTGFVGDAKDRLFEPFYTTKPNGLGMGLVISRSIVEEHGGKLWAERRGDETIFSFTVPFDCRIR